MQPSLASMSEDQRRKWRNPKRRAIANLLQVIGDKPVAEISRGDALDFRSWWSERVLEDGIQIGTANKDIGHLNKMLRTLDRQHRLGLDPVFSQLRIESEEARSRAAFDVCFVATRIFAEGAPDGLNAEARAIAHLMAETGLRVSEAVNLDAGTIELDHPVPHVQVRPNGRKLKTPQSQRDIPLVGVALAAMRDHPDGFPRYRDKGSSLSALVNKVLDTRGLRPTKAHSLYSLRHTFEDRLGAANIPEKIVAALVATNSTARNTAQGRHLSRSGTHFPGLSWEPVERRPIEAPAWLSFTGLAPPGRWCRLDWPTEEHNSDVEPATLR